MGGDVLGRDYCIRGVGVVVLGHPWTKLLSSGLFNRERG